MASLTQAFAIDLTGQVCADQFHGEFYGGVSTQPDFHRGAAKSPEGKPIVCLSSTTDDGGESRIRPSLLAGEGVTLARADVHYVVTEFGIAYLFGKSVRERALALIEIAHPDFRESLLDEAKRQSLVPAAHRLGGGQGYLVEEERVVQLKSGSKVMLRPARGSDVKSMQVISLNDRYGTGLWLIASRQNARPIAQLMRRRGASPDRAWRRPPRLSVRR
jgi:acyl-CoA hydrolase